MFKVIVTSSLKEEIDRIRDKNQLKRIQKLLEKLASRGKNVLKIWTFRTDTF